MKIKVIANGVLCAVCVCVGGDRSGRRQFHTRVAIVSNRSMRQDMQIQRRTHTQRRVGW